MIACMNPLYLRMYPKKVISRLVSYFFFEGRPLTTRGRWINPIVFALFSIEKRLSRSKAVKKPIFIIGMGRSGTTILGIVMSVHRQIGFLNEPKAMWHAIYSAEDVIGNYSRGLAKYRLQKEDANEDIANKAHKLYGAYLRATFSERALTKYPELIFREPFIKTIFPDAKFIFLVRNGWDVCHSISSWSQRLSAKHAAETHDWWGVNQRKWKLLVDQVVLKDPVFKDILEEIKKMDRHIDMAAVEWIVAMREGLTMMREGNKNLHMMRFEELASDPVGILSETIKFCELNRDEKFLKYARKVLSPVQSKDPLKLHPALMPIVTETMRLLNYK